jgi:ribosomal-protein-alanine N-acetyltransferase
MALLLNTDRLEIRELDLGDFSAVHACVSDPLVAQWFPWGPNTEAETRAFLEGVVRADTLTERASIALAIVLRGVGLIGVCFLDRRMHREFEVGYYIHRNHWSQGFATEAIEAIVPFAFGELEAHRVFARVDAENPKSAQVLERADFRLEGKLDQERLIKGESRETLVYVLLAEDCAV